MNTTRDILNNITEKLCGKYIIEVSKEFTKYVDPSLETIVVYLKRNKTTIFWKTIVIIKTKIVNIKKMYEFIALIKESLPDPSNADLYLFSIIEDNNSLGQCLKIESSELLCRKFVLRPQETIIEMLSRSFLIPLDNYEQESINLNPIENAIKSTKSKHSWLKANELKKWRTLFNSNLNNLDIVDKIIE